MKRGSEALLLVLLAIAAGSPAPAWRVPDKKNHHRVIVTPCDQRPVSVEGGVSQPNLVGIVVQNAACRLQEGDTNSDTGVFNTQIDQDGLKRDREYEEAMLFLDRLAMGQVHASEQAGTEVVSLRESDEVRGQVAEEEVIGDGIQPRVRRKRNAKCIVCNEGGHNKRTCPVFLRILDPTSKDTDDKELWVINNLRNHTACRELLHAARHLPTQRISELVTLYGADVNFCIDGGMGESALHIAATWGRCEVISCLVTLGADVNLAGKVSGWTPLHRAALIGDSDPVEKLIGLGARVDAKDCEGHTPLHLAAREGMQTVLCLLIEAGADVEAANNAGSTSIMLAAMRGEGGTLLQLASIGASLTARDSAGSSLLEYALMDPENETMPIVSALMSPSPPKAGGFGLESPIIIDGDSILRGEISAEEALARAVGTSARAPEHPLSILRSIKDDPEDDQPPPPGQADDSWDGVRFVVDGEEVFPDFDNLGPEGDGADHLVLES